MSNRILILYSSVDGQTLKICNKISKTLQQEGFTVDLFEVSNFQGDISNYSKLIVGASIRYGKHHKEVSSFIDKNLKQLKNIKTAFFSVNLVARKEDKNQFNTNPYVMKFFEKQQWKPDIIDVFAGKLDYGAYSFFDKLMIKLIMKMTKGPTKTEWPIEYTDWNRVDDFIIKILRL
ncbi:menaquinone-dependent protoporphyrinogen IX dehydrogenase [Aestuariibaculum lutulentum]|uniref:Protoporphyrinogen IX dehydrogenase [quinone] n=1 Tax=Aestuariibaculum lutulentum TaxID=2920935 RepID=A0ABS9RLE3_9FLAO|nr:menaquinone-dependent protoporphyrinogen IX dehydrogenase [Aestuariibaculum lutulentum]MCH4553768.1 menaquinone-dependent protoporphyrinogen IX dehydrogenase [Aestuariibaculum lutulentum]